MDALQPYWAFLSTHVVGVVLVSSFVEAAGLPFPGRLTLIVAASLVSDLRQLVSVGAAATVGSLLGDHIPYGAGYYVGPRLLTFYCRLTLGSEHCVAKALAYFQRFGAAAVLVGRFSTTVRLLAAALSGCGHISYARFLVCDVIGTLVYAGLWVTTGYLFGSQALALLERYGVTKLAVLVIPVAVVAVLAYRLWRRLRHGPAQAELLASCAVPPATVSPRASSRHSSLGARIDPG